MATAPDRTLLTAARIAMRYPHSPKEAAQRFGLSYSHLNAVTNGSLPLRDYTRQRLIENIRDEEIALADKICAENGW